MSVARRFWDKVAVGDVGECWQWKASILRNGYGQFGFEGKMTGSHRVAFYLTHGHWPEPCCLHSCDNRACCNPAHLWEGTKKENSLDMVLKGRVITPPRDGENNGRAKLTRDEVLALRANPLSGARLREYAEKREVHPETIRRAQKGEFWSCL